MFLQDHDTLIHFWGSILSVTKPGYDRTMTLVYATPREGGDKKLLHDFKFHDRTLRTNKILSDFKADPIIGRATRVWSAHDINRTDPIEYVIRDTWTPAGSKSETEIRNQLRQSIENNLDLQKQEYDLKIFENHFLPHCKHLSGPVDVSLSPHPFCQSPPPLSEIRDISLLPKGKAESDKFSLQGSQHATSNPEALTTPPPVFSRPTSTEIITRIHYRDVYEKRCASYEELCCAETMMKTLYDCTKGKPSPYLMFSMCVSHHLIIPSP